MKLSINWQLRDLPLTPSAVFVPIELTKACVSKLLTQDDEYLHSVRGLYSEVGLIIIGSLNLLPWINGCAYLGYDKFAPHLMLNTLYEPTVPIDMVDAAFYAVYQQNLAILHNQQRIIPIDNAKKLSRNKLKGLV